MATTSQMQRKVREIKTHACGLSQIWKLLLLTRLVVTMWLLLSHKNVCVRTSPRPSPVFEQHSVWHLSLWLKSKCPLPSAERLPAF